MDEAEKNTDCDIIGCKIPNIVKWICHCARIKHFNHRHQPFRQMRTPKDERATHWSTRIWSGMRMCRIIISRPQIPNWFDIVRTPSLSVPCFTIRTILRLLGCQKRWDLIPATRPHPRDPRWHILITSHVKIYRCDLNDSRLTFAERGELKLGGSWEGRIIENW